MDDYSKPIEYQVEATAGEAGGELDRIVDILERMDASISGVASSLSNLRSASADVSAAFDKVRSGNARAFNADRAVNYQKRLLGVERLANRLSKSGNTDELVISRAMKSGIKEAQRINAELDKVDENSPEFKVKTAALDDVFDQLDMLVARYNQLDAERTIKLDAEIDKSVEKALSVDKSNKDTGFYEHRPNGVVGKAQQYSAAQITEEINNGVDGRVKDVADVKIHFTSDLADVQKELDRLERAIQRNKNNIVKFSAAGDQKSLQREMKKLSANEAAQAKFEEVKNSAGAGKAWSSMKADININTPEDYAAVEAAAKKLEKAIRADEIAMKRFAAAGDAVDFEKMKKRIEQATFELNRQKEALSGASGIKVQADNSAQLEDVYKNMDRLRSQIDKKEFMGKNSFNSVAVRKLRMEMTEAEREALRLRMSLGEIGGGAALAKNAKLTAKGFLQARFHAARMNAELRKSQHSLLKVSRVLQLMVLRASVRAIMKDMNAGFATLASQFEPFNEAMSRLMDASTNVRNSLVSVFDPLIRVGAPLATKALNTVAYGLDKVAQITAAMTGETYYTKLTSEAQDYNKTVNDVQNSLAGFDKFNLIGNRTYAGGVNYKTDVDRVAIDEKFLKWKTVGDGIKELFEGAGEVVKQVLEDIADLLGRVDGEDAVEFIGRTLKNTGQYLKEHKEGIADLIETYVALRLAIKAAFGAYMLGKGIASPVKGLWNFGKALFGGSKAAAAGQAATSASLGLPIVTATAGKSAIGGTLATGLLKGGLVLGELAILSKGTAATIDNIQDAKGSLKDWSKENTGEDMSGWDSFKLYWQTVKANGGLKETSRKEDAGEKLIIPGYTDKTGLVQNTGANLPSVGSSAVQSASNVVTEINKSGLVDKLSTGVENAVTAALSKSGGQKVDVAVKAVAEPSNIFKLVVTENNSQYNRTGRSPLRV